MPTITNELWEEHKPPRAVVPSQSMLESERILAASPAHISDSPSAHGLGVYALSKSGERHALPLYYVSRRIASESKSAGLQSGWYVIGEPGQQFEISLSFLRGANSLAYTAPGADMTIADVSVDGVSAGRIRSQYFSYTDVLWRGFPLWYQYEPHENTQCKNTLSTFSFCKSTVKEYGACKTDSMQGTITLRLESGVKSFVPNERSHGGKKFHRYSEPAHNSAVDEKKAIKQGVSIGVRRDGEMLMENIVHSDYVVENRTLLSHASITIFIRERYWMESRKIIDIDGKPYVPTIPNAVPVVIDLEADDEIADVEDAKPIKIMPENTTPSVAVVNLDADDNLNELNACRKRVKLETVHTAHKQCKIERKIP